MFSLFLAFLLPMLAMAAPMSNEINIAGWDTTTSYGTGGGIIGFIVLIIDIIIFVEVIKSSRPPVHKLGWCLVVFLFPILGAIIYFFFSNRAAHKSGAGYEPIA